MQYKQQRQTKRRHNLLADKIVCTPNFCLVGDN